MHENEVWILQDPSAPLPLSTGAGRRAFQAVDSLLTAADESDVAPGLLVIDLTALAAGAGTGALRVLASLQVPLLVVCAPTESRFLEEYYRAGADDFALKPVNEAELQARIGHWRSVAAAEGGDGLSPYAMKNGVAIDPLSLTVVRGAQRTPPLTSKEFQIATFLCRSIDPVVARDEMVRRLWRNTAVSPKTLDVHIYNLRKKLIALGILVRQVPPGAFALEFAPLPVAALLP